MGTYYYWINEKLKIGVYLGRGLNAQMWDSSDVDSIMKIKYDGLFSEKLCEALSEKTLKDLTLKDLSMVLDGARYFSDFSVLVYGEIEVHTLDKLFGKGEIITDYELKDYKDYKIYEEPEE